MKQLILFLVLCFSNLSFGQFSNDICSFEKEIISDFKLPKQYKQELITIKRKFIRKMYKDTNSVLCNLKEYGETYYAFSHRFDTTLYVYDFNYDGKKDILFFGRMCPGYESTDVCIFVRDGKNYTVKKLGTWIISMNLKKSSFEMTTVKYPCCSDYILQAMKYEHKKGNDSITQLTNQIFGFEECTDQLISKDTIVSIKTGSELIIGPDIEITDPEMYDEEFETVIGIFMSDQRLSSSTQVLINGKMWYYVVVPVDETFALSGVWNYSQFGKLTTARGWVCLKE